MIVGRKNLASFSACALVAALCCLSVGAAAPRLTVGISSDPHISLEHPERSRHLAAAFEIMKREGADVVVVVGDLTEKGTRPELTEFFRVWESVFQNGRGVDGKKVERFCVYGNHDFMDSSSIPEAFRRKHAHEAIRPDSGISRSICGVPFLGVRWKHEREDAERLFRANLSELESGRPFFYVQHDPKSFVLSEMLPVYPAAIALTGHTHESIAGKGALRRGFFTSIAAGTTLNGHCAVLRLFEDRAEYVRYDCQTGRSFGEADVWRLPDGKPNRSFVFATWNIGHFSWGKSWRSTLNVTNSDQRAAAYRAFPAIAKADVLGLCEYSEEFTADESRDTRREVLRGFQHGAIGPRRAYQCNAVFHRRFPLLERREKFYSRHVQDTYYEALKLEVFGHSIWFVETHLDWDERDPAHAGDREHQMRTLIADFRSEPRVVIGGDFNLSAFNADGSRYFTVGQLRLFKEAGYLMANDGTVATAKRGAPIDNIFVKGLEMSEVRFYKAGDLSDHSAISCRLRLGNDLTKRTESE